MRLIYILGFLLVTSSWLFSQTYRFNEYSTADGIAQNFIYSINQDKNGFLWIGTGEGISRFDGKEFTTFTTSDGLAEDIVTTSYIDSGGNIWFGHNEGSITLFNGSGFQEIEGPDTAFSTIKGFSQFNNNLYIAAQNDGLFTVSNKKLEHIGDFDRGNFTSIQTLSENEILMGTAEGLIYLTNNSGNWQIQDEALSDVWISDLSRLKDSSNFLVGTQSAGLYQVRVRNGLIEKSKWDSNNKLDELMVTDVFQDKNENIWLSTQGQGIIKLSVTESEVSFYSTSTGLNSNFIQTAFDDREGNIWIGTFGNGLVSLIDDLFTFYSSDLEMLENKSVYCMTITNGHRWYGTEHGLLKIEDKKNASTFFTDTTSWIDAKVSSLTESGGYLWIGTENQGAYKLNIETNEIEKLLWPYGSLQEQINEIVCNDLNAYIATNGGLIIYEIETGEHTLFDTEAGLAHNAIQALYVDDDGAIWLGTFSRYLYAITGSSLEEYEVTTFGELEVVSIDQDELGSIWIATGESGVYKLQGDQFIHFGEKEGLKTNYCYAIHHDSRGNMWVGHRGSLSKISLNGEKITVFDSDDGIKEKVNRNAIFLDDQEHIWFGTDNGPIRYNSSINKVNDVAPVINITSILINGESHSLKEEIELPYGNYRVLFSYVGIAFKNADKVSYQYKLNGYDEVFSDPTTEQTATYGRLSDGTYTFEVIACNEDGYCSEEPVKFDLTIKAPIWKKAWFYILIFLALTFGIYFFVQSRIKRINANRKYLKEQLDLKTREVVEKANQIEEINEDLTSSISYAKRIQTSILPNISDLTNLLPKSFVYYKPRDIVSGDFYYIDVCGDKLIIGCVDCTGHGVPGGFMSMIGSVTLRNIYMANHARNIWETPEKILEKLDQEIEHILKQNIKHTNEEMDFYKSREGMDMTLVEIDLNTKEVLLSSAMRTSLILKDGVLENIAGTKRPIGGGDTLTMPFELKNFNLKKGDGLYLFTDGYSDQFGGPKGRKLKLAGVKNIINALSAMPHSEHENFIKNEFENWMDDYPQIDDVLFIGIEF